MAFNFMKQKIFLCLLLILLPQIINAQQRSIAVTIDDLPVVALQKDLQTRQEITRKLLKQITDANIPAIGFVNEFKLYDKQNNRDEAQIDLLRQWIDAGLELGNHTFSHLSLNNNPLEKYQDEILRGEIITKELLAAQNNGIRYFRHPYLLTGKSMQTKRKLAEFLDAHGYTIAPVTFDNDDYMFARVYDIALERGDEKLRQRVLKAYLPYLQMIFDYWERQSVKLFKREPKQVLLLHANSINAECFGKVVEMMKKRGYKFNTVEAALTDEVYRLPDTYTGIWGYSWLRRWALAKGKKFVLQNAPFVPDFIAEIYEKHTADDK